MSAQVQSDAPAEEVGAGYGLDEIAKALDISERHTGRRADKENWPFIINPGRGRFGGKRQYRLSDLPQDIRIALLKRHAPPVLAKPKPAGHERKRGELRHVTDEEIARAGVYWEGLTDKRRAVPKQRLEGLLTVEALLERGMPKMEARAVVAEKYAGVRGMSSQRLLAYRAMVGDAPRSAWLVLLCDHHRGHGQGARFAACDEQCWLWYKSYYLSKNRPTHTETYRRCKEMADAQGWTLPSTNTMKRRMNREVPLTTQTLHRNGRMALRGLLPVQARDVTCFAPGEAVNGDGLSFDRMWIRFEDDDRVKGAKAWFWQDIYSRRQMAWRLDKTENTDVFRLATYDLTAVCAPRQAWMDNTRAAANKTMTAGAQGRHRFKSDPEDGQGLLLMLGIEPHFTNPDKWTGNPGAKPIERAFGIGGIHDAIVNNPKIIAAGGGRTQETALPVALVREVIAEEVARFNARRGRRTQICKGELSFDEAWAQGMQGHVPRVLTAEQRRVLLMSREVVRATSERGQVWIKAGRGPFGRNGYWSEGLAQYAGEKVVVLYDPENLSADAHVYTLEGEFICTAEHVPTHAFNNTKDGREWAKVKKRRAKSLIEVAESEARMTALEMEALYTAATNTGSAPDAGTANATSTAGTDTGGQTAVRGHFGKTPSRERAQRKEHADEEMGVVVELDAEARKRQQNYQAMLEQLDKQHEQEHWMDAVGHR